MLYLGDNPIAGLVKPIAARNIGEIVASSLPLTDAGLHLLDGSLIQGGGIYQGFVDYIADLYTANPSANYWTTEALWQQAVTTYGVCGKFVYDSVNNTVRLPKITGIIEGTTDVSALGDLVEAGLPNITGEFSLGGGTGTTDTSLAIGCFKKGPTTYDNVVQNQFVGGSSKAFDASLSSSIYGNSSTVQPQTIKAFYYIVVANSTKTDIQVDIDEIATDLNGKADTDLTNVTDTGYIKMAGASMPSNRYIDLTLGASDSTYTAPADGWFNIAKNLNDYQYVDFQNTTSNYFVSDSTGGGHSKTARLAIPAKKNYVIRISYNSTGSTAFFRFIYAVGSESEAS
jgi:hypothetical protein